MLTTRIGFDTNTNCFFTMYIPILLHNSILRKTRHASAISGFLEKKLRYDNWILLKKN